MIRKRIRVFKKRPLRRRRVYRRRTTSRKKVYIRGKQASTQFSVGRPLPDRTFYRLRYVYEGNQTHTLGVLSSQVNFQSSLFDPELSVGGHQPMFYDQLCNLYSRYRVFGIKWSWTIINGSSSQGFYAIMKASSSNTFSETSLKTLLERGNIKYRIGTGSTGSRNVIYMKGYMSVAKTLGVTSEDVRSDDYYTASTGNSPIRMAYLYPIVYPFDASDVVFRHKLELTYYCEMFDRIEVASS